jgi:pyruvate,water dikinase
MNDPLTPKRPLAPALPMAVPQTDAAVASKPLGTGHIPTQDGDTLLVDRGRFDSLAHRDDVPGAAGVPEVKVLILGIDGEDPELYFINSTSYQYHFDFARQVLGSTLTLGDFNRITYFSDDRKNLAGTVLAHDSFADAVHPKGLFATELWPTDPVSAPLAIRAWKLIAAGMPFASGQVAYHPSGIRQEELYQAALDDFAKEGVPVILSAVLFANMRFSALNLGVGYGRLRIIDPADARAPGLSDIALFKSLPNDLTHVGGVLSEEPQTPLSHVNLRAKQNDTPNAYLRNAATDPKILPYLGSIVRYEVQAEDLVITPASVDEMNEFYADRRPAKVQIPPRDLSATEIVELDDAGHDGVPVIGAKAANLAELRKLLGHVIVPEGRGIPFSFYDRFMVENGFYDEVRKMIAEPTFQDDPEARDQRLAAFRKKIKRAKVPAELGIALDAMRAAFAPSQALRCRSSTNSEDLEGFNGAGLYDSFTHRPDEGRIEVTVKKVWASLWNLRAFDERDFYRIDHFEASMAVLVHPNFDNELANGVALTKNVYFPGFEGFYINVQVGEALVTNPDPNAVPEELLVMQDAADETGTKFETIYIRRSTLTKDGVSVLTPSQIDILRENLRLIQTHFRTVYKQDLNKAFAMDVEFKFDVGGALVIKQARPWVD